MSPVWVLIGPPGSGKSTVGALLADRLEVSYRDTDADIEDEFGKAVSDIFVDEGEAFFRDAEVRAVARALAEHDGVLALGGGAVMRPETQKALEGHQVAFLDVTLSTASQRVGLGASRPLLVGNVRGTMKRLLDERRPVYEQIATLTIATDGLTPTEVVDAMMDAS